MKRVANCAVAVDLAQACITPLLADEISAMSAIPGDPFVGLDCRNIREPD
jgi:hypothetical protein